MANPEQTISGIHHVTAITADAQKNIDFYCGVLGLRLVKLTVNFDDPSSYHFYYGDELGRPGTIMTFFAWPGANRGRVGPPQVTATAFAVRRGAVEYWDKRLKEHGAQTVTDRFDEPSIGFVDPDGMRLEIVGVADPKGIPWAAGPIPIEYAIRGFHGVTISERAYENTAKLLREVMGYTSVGRNQNRYRYCSGGDFACNVDVLDVSDVHHGSMGAGTVHHVAFRTSDDAQQEAWHAQIVRCGLNVSPIMERVYFRSIYFREPGGVLFEIATDKPGFTADQTADQLGTRLMLPPWLESHRAGIEQAVPMLRLPATRS